MGKTVLFMFELHHLALWQELGLSLQDCFLHPISMARLPSLPRNHVIKGICSWDITHFYSNVASIWRSEKYTKCEVSYVKL